MDSELNPVSLDTLCASLCEIMGIDPPACAAPSNPILTGYAENAFGGNKADRILMYNPDAVAEWIYRKYPFFTKEVCALTDIEVPMQTVMPSVTPVCFGTMYTGAQPEVHGIRKYSKPVIHIDTIWDALIRAGKKPCIIADSECSMGKIFLEREMDYYIFDTVDEINAAASRIIAEDKYDLIAVYNGNYDSVMHKTGPESPEALGELRSNSHVFAMLEALVSEHWQSHNTLIGFAMDHGCHPIDGGCGAHGLDMPEDMNIVHRYRAVAKKH